MEATSLAYWMTTWMVVFAMFSGGIAELTGRPETINGMKELGYPVYFVMILGVWKLLGSLALVIPGFARLKEWAYALALASWALRPADRTLGRNQPTALAGRLGSQPLVRWLSSARI